MNELFEKLQKYNFWNTRPIVGFQRKDYLNRIKKYLNNKLVKVIVGQRRVGKSYVLRQIIDYLIEQMHINPQNIFYLNKEYIDFDEINDYKQLDTVFKFYKTKLNVQGKIYIFLDEVQNIDGWEKFVNSYSQEYTSDYEIFVSGSNSKLLSKEFASFLSGRYVEIKIYPYSYDEYLGLTNSQRDKNSYLNYLQQTGLPEIYHLADLETKRNYVQSLKNTIVLRDIIARYSVKDVELLESLFKFVVSNIGSQISINNIINYYKSIGKKTNYETVSNYIDYLSDTMIIHKFDRYDIKGKQILGGQRKFFLNDLGFRNYLLGFRANDIEAILENAVVLQLMIAGYSVSIGFVGHNEIDFVAQKNNTIIYVQVAYILTDNKVVEREFGNLLKIDDNYTKIVVSLDDVKFDDYKGIKHCRAWELNSML